MKASGSWIPAVALCLLAAGTSQAQTVDCHGTVQALRMSHPYLHCSCRGANTMPDCSDTRAPTPGGGSQTMSFSQQMGMTLMQSLLQGMNTPPQQPQAPPPPNTPEFIPNPAYEEALKKLSDLGRPDSELRKMLVDELSAVPPSSLPPKTPDIPKQLLLSACLGKEAARASAKPGQEEESELLLRQSASAMEGRLFASGDPGCAIPKPQMPDNTAVQEKRAKAAELAADLLGKVGELKSGAAQARERASRAAAAAQEADKTAREDPEDKSLLEAARQEEAEAQRELDEAKAEAERLDQEADEASRKARDAVNRLDEAGNDEKKLDDFSKEFGNDR